ncbi:GumC family protein [Phenylobacterium sp.]|jgi:capsular exopolysaccharide synthesis family protein|uniref:GumC family protein n=1 Tax=Phenylobacterium sp. TaxID=1871053 RepID=UPI002F3FBA5D
MSNIVPVSHVPMTTGGLPQQYVPERPELRTLLGMLLQRAGLGLGVAAAIFAVVVLYTWTREPLYTAYGSVLVDPKQEHLTRAKAPDFNGTPDTSAVDTQVELLRSREVAQALVNRFNLGNDHEFNPAVRPGKRANPKDLPRVIDRVQDRIAIGRNGQTYIITVGFSSAAPEKAATLSNGLMQAFLNKELQDKVARVERAKVELGASLETMRRDAEAAEARVQEYRNNHGLFSAQGSTMAEQEVSTLNQQIAGARAETAEKRARLEAALAQVGRGGGGEDVGAALGSETIRELRKTEADTSVKLAQLQADFQPGYPEVVRTQAQLDNVRAAIQKEIKRILSSLSADSQAAAQREASLLGSRNVAQGGLAANGQAQVGLLALQQRADSARQIYEAYLNRAKEVAAEGSLQEADASITARAFVPTKPSTPNKPLMLLLATLLSLIGGAAAILIAEFWARTMRNGSDIERELGVRFAGLIPDYASVAGRMRERGPTAASDYMVTQPLSSFAEALRNLRAFLLYSAGGAPFKLVAVTSAVPREGKSMTSLCLARAMALSGSRVLAMDCDLRQRGLTRLIGDAKLGIVQVVEGSASLEQALLHDSKTGLWILPAAHGAAPYDLFTNPKTDALFEHLGAKFDYIIMDTPPILGIADARILATKADRVLYAVHWNKTPLRTAQSAIEILRECGADIAGALLTRVDVKRQARFGYQDSSDYFHAYRKYYATVA